MRRRIGFWRSLRQWWSWDGSPDTDPFRDRVLTRDEQVSSDVSGHAHATVEPEPLPAEEETDA
jgi:hypothetical protein